MRRRECMQRAEALLNLAVGEIAHAAEHGECDDDVLVGVHDLVQSQRSHLRALIIDVQRGDEPFKGAAIDAIDAVDELAGEIRRGMGTPINIAVQLEDCQLMRQALRRIGERQTSHLRGLRSPTMATGDREPTS